MDSLASATGPELQRDVQRLLGRCLLRIQQYERLLKGILVSHELVGSAETIELRREQRVQLFANKTLGQLTKSLFETYVVPENFERELLRGPKPALPQVAVSSRIEMSSDRRKQAQAAIEDLVELRNELVHHLIEKFDLWSDAGCAAAIDYLEQSYDRVDWHFSELSGWARSMEASRALAAEFARSPAFVSLVVDCIAPDGTFDWPMSGIVRALREAAQKFGTSGWVELGQARRWLEEAHPDQTPEKYGCRTWPQVLTESKLFELQYRFDEATQRKVAWFRKRAP